MKAFAVDDLGEPGSVRDVPTPEPGQGHVRIRVAAAGLNPFDIAVMQGYLKDRMEHRFPLVPGMDASGTVEATGPGTTTWSVGDEVFGSVGKPYLGEGTLAELVTMSQGTIARKPASIDHLAAASIPVAGVTALTMVDAGSVAGGDVVVVVGATGGVGSFLVQLAARREGRVVAVCRGQNAEYARSIGAADVIDYTEGDVADTVRSRYPEGIDVIADLHGDRDVVASLADLLRTKGRVISAVGSADVDALRGRGVEASNVSGRVSTDALDTLARLIEQKELAIPEVHSFPLADAAGAVALVASGHTRGKVVVIPD